METPLSDNLESPGPRDYKYWAFISYSHQDEAWALWVQRILERYRVPKSLRGRKSSVGFIPKRLFPVFRDRDELAAAPDLGEKIREALESSRWLLVICSKASAASPWVAREIELFRSLARHRQILCLIIDGTPHASSNNCGLSEECFAPTLLTADAEGRTVQPLAVDVRRNKDSKRDAKLRIIAGTLGIGFDDLKLRDERRRRMRTLLVGASSLAIGPVVCFVYFLAADGGAMIPGAQLARRTMDRHNFSLLRPVAERSVIAREAADFRKMLIQKLMEELRTGRWQAPTLSQAKSNRMEVWTSAQAITSLLKSPELADQDAAECLRALQEAFSPDMVTEVNGTRFGWIPGHTSFPQAEPALWVLTATSLGLGRQGLLEKDTRREWMQRLDYAQSAALQYVGTNGEWYCVGGTERPTNPGIYTSALALMMLLETRAAGLPWQSSLARRDELLRDTASWLVANFHEGPTPGWSSTPGTTVAVDGLTLQIFGLLLRAEKEAGIPLPDQIHASMRERLMSIETRPASYPNVTIRPSFQFRDHLNHPRSEFISIRCLWRPWAIHSASHWLSSSHPQKALPEQRVRIQRVLGYLTIGRPEGRSKNFDPTKWSGYVAAEYLYCLSFVPEP
jgi:hypothetical protein